MRRVVLKGAEGKVEVGGETEGGVGWLRKRSGLKVSGEGKCEGEELMRELDRPISMYEPTLRSQCSSSVEATLDSESVMGEVTW